MIDIKEEALKLHEENKGKLEVKSRIKIDNKKALSLVYTPGVAEPCLKIRDDKRLAYRYTNKWNSIAVVTDGSAVLGLGNIGGLASLPVMEGKAVLFKEFANVDAYPIILDTQNVDEIVMIIKNIAPGFGGINLEDISAPRCFEIEKRLKKELDIPVFHDDQHGTAIVVLSGLINSAKVVQRDLKDFKVVINGAGAAGVAIAKILLSVGVKNIIVCDSKGVIYNGRGDLNASKEEIAKLTNLGNLHGGLKDAIVNCDVFIGVSMANVLNKEMVKTMAKNPVIFAMANPMPEINPKDAYEAGACIVATGRSDFPNQINNVLAFPGVFRGALDAKAVDINEEMKLAAAKALAGLINEDDLANKKIIVEPFDPRIVKVVSNAVKDAAIKSSVSRA